MRIFLTLISLIFAVSATSQVFIDHFTDLENVDFGFCNMAMGIAVVGGECVYISGCGWEEGGLDYFPELYTSFESCEEGCLQEKDSQDFAGMDFGVWKT